MPSYAARFWNEREEYHDLARRYERGISIEHPSAARNHCPWCYHCSFAASTIVHYDAPNFVIIK